MEAEVFRTLVMGAGAAMSVTPGFVSPGRIRPWPNALALMTDPLLLKI